jgi:RNA polymerase sigma-70 factor, ECF subfamily
MSDIVSLAENPYVHPNRCTGVSPDGAMLLSRGDFEIFAREYAGRLAAVATRFLRSAEDAADAVQDAFLSAYAARHTFQGQSTVYTWLYRIVMNTCLMRIRAKQLRKNRCGEAALSLCDHQGGFAAAAARPVIEVLEREEIRAVIHAKIRQLPGDYRAVLLLRDIEELNTSETAQRLQLSLEAVKTRLHRARQALRSLLEPADCGAMLEC